jgi:hypothetical protein
MRAITRLSGLMEDLGRIVVQWAHVLTGVLWVGGGSYSTLMQRPALAAMPMPPAVRPSRPSDRDRFDTCCGLPTSPRCHPAGRSRSSSAVMAFIAYGILGAMVTARFS